MGDVEWRAPWLQVGSHNIETAREGSMMRRIVMVLVAGSLMMAAPRMAAAGITHTFDRVDAVESFESPINRIAVTGVLAGATAPVTVMFHFVNFYAGDQVAERCARMAVISMSKPGKYRFSIGDYSSNNEMRPGGCKLALRNP